MRFVLLAVLAAGCYDPSIADGVYLCPDKVCPSNMVCSGCGACIHEGEPATTGCRSCADAIACIDTMFCPIVPPSPPSECIQGCEKATTPETRAKAEVVLDCLRQQCNFACMTGENACRNCRHNVLRGPGSPLGPCQGVIDATCAKCVPVYQMCAASP